MPQDTNVAGKGPLRATMIIRRSSTIIPIGKSAAFARQAQRMFA
jgi:hypothetical protein